MLGLCTASYMVIIVLLLCLVTRAKENTGGNSRRWLRLAGWPVQIVKMLSISTAQDSNSQHLVHVTPKDGIDPAAHRKLCES